MDHPTTVADMTPEDLAVAVGNMRYDALARFLVALSKKLMQDGQSDIERGRYTLAGHLLNAAGGATKAALHVALAWKTSEPHMPDTNQQD